MGNSSGKEARAEGLAGSRAHERPADPTSPTSPGAPSSSLSSSNRQGGNVYSSRLNRGSRPDLSFLGIGGHPERDPSQPEPRRETKQEREKRKLEKEWEQRKKERERSLKDEGVDGGYLVTLGTYTGTEDFSKPTVRQLMIERRIAPFWRGLQDHEDTWTEHQLVAVARGQPLPPADEVPAGDPHRPQSNSASSGDRPQDLNSLTVPISSRSQSYASETSNLSPSHPAFSRSSSPPISSPSSTPFFKGRAKALAALKTSHGGSQADMTPQEVMLTKDPYVNGQPIEAFLYKDAQECPICFLYYPPYLNKTRCCDQAICSECFVQIKRPDPHPPEHHGEGPDPNNPNDQRSGEQLPPEEEGMLVSEPAACPFCVQPEFGVTYDPPPFRRGLAYGNSRSLGIQGATSAMSSSSSLNSQGVMTPGGTQRRRGTSLSASSPQVITTDRIRPDWAKKLSDARAHALRRAAAATALHNAAYVLGNVGSSDGRSLLGRRRRMFSGLGDSSNNSGNGTSTQRVPESMSLSQVGAMLAAADRERARGETLAAMESSSGQSGRRRERTRMEDIEELMMLEAIRLSLAEEENRRKKEEKEEQKRLAKEEKEGRKREAKEEKKAAKEQKKAEKAARKASGGSLPYSASGNASTTSGFAPPQTPVEGKGKGIDRGPGFTSLSEPRVNIADESNASAGPSSSPRGEAQRHLEESRAQIQHMDQSSISAATPAINVTNSDHRASLRNLSNPSSSASSMNESTAGSLGGSNYASDNPSPNLSPLASPASALDDPLSNETPPAGGGTEPMFNFGSLATMVNAEGKEAESSTHVEDISHLSPELQGSPESGRSRGDSGESSGSSVPPVLSQAVGGVDGDETSKSNDDDIEQVKLTHSATQQSDPYDTKHFGDVGMLDTKKPPSPTTVPKFPPSNPWANAQ